MNFKKNSTLIVGCGIAAVLLIVAIFFLVKNHGSYRSNIDSLQSAKGRLNALNNRNPFPSTGNITLAGENLELIKGNYHTVLASLQREQLQSEPIEPARFAPMLEETSRRIRAKAAEAGVTLPSEPGLGFKDYAAGKLPPNDPGIMERLVIQIKAVEDLCTLLLDARISTIDSMQRDEFELRADAMAAPQVEARGRGRAVAGRPAAQAAVTMVGGLPVPKYSEQYSTERFTVSFTGRESAIWEVLNRMINRKVFYVIVDLTFDNTRVDLGKPVDMKARLAALTAATRAGQPSGTTTAVLPQLTMEALTREDRVIGGREPIKAKVVVDMYRFHDTTQTEGGQP